MQNYIKWFHFKTFKFHNHQISVLVVFFFFLFRIYWTSSLYKYLEIFDWNCLWILFLQNVLWRKGWPLTTPTGEVILHLGALDDVLVRPGDLYLCVKSGKLIFHAEKYWKLRFWQPYIHKKLIWVLGYLTRPSVICVGTIVLEHKWYF